MVVIMASLVCEAFGIHFVAFANAQVTVFSDTLLMYVLCYLLLSMWRIGAG